MKRILTDDGIDITEGVQVILDAFAHGMEAGSGFLDWREMCAIRQVAWAMGLNVEDFVSEAGYKEAGYDTRAKRRPVWDWPDPASPLTDLCEREVEWGGDEGDGPSGYVEVPEL